MLLSVFYVLEARSENAIKSLSRDFSREIISAQAWGPTQTRFKNSSGGVRLWVGGLRPHTPHSRSAATAASWSLGPGPCPNGPGPWGLVPMGPGALSQWAMGWSLVPMGRAPGLVPMGPGPGALSQWAMGWSQWALGLEPFAQWARSQWAQYGSKLGPYGPQIIVGSFWAHVGPIWGPGPKELKKMF